MVGPRWDLDAEREREREREEPASGALCCCDKKVLLGSRVAGERLIKGIQMRVVLAEVVKSICIIYGIHDR
jgi:transposase